MNTIAKICIIALIIICGFTLFTSLTPQGKIIWNRWIYSIQKADDDTNYETLKHVEDTCRAMKTSYDADRVTYEQYKDAEGEKQTWAEEAKMRANRTASTYNEYILKNSFVWKDNVPTDIAMKLEMIE